MNIEKFTLQQQTIPIKITDTMSPVQKKSVKPLKKQEYKNHKSKSDDSDAFDFDMI